MGDSRFQLKDVDTPIIGCLCYKAFSEWHLGELTSCQAKLDEAISLAKELNDMHGLAVALGWATGLAEIEHDPAGVERLASDLIELATRHNFAYWLAEGGLHRGWARCASGDTVRYSLDRTGNKRHSGNWYGAGPPILPGTKGRSIASSRSRP